MSDRVDDDAGVLEGITNKENDYFEIGSFPAYSVYGMYFVYEGWLKVFYDKVGCGKKYVDGVVFGDRGITFTLDALYY
jgi:hypothetical protein